MRWAKSTAAASILVTLFAGIISNQATAAPPTVAKAVPDNGDIGVDPNLKEIRITFDQPMGEGMSVVGGGETFPKMLGKPTWSGARTLTMRVKLEPNHEYWLSINNASFQNFTNSAGEPAVPYPIKFRTGRRKTKAADKGKAEEKDPDTAEKPNEANRAAIEKLRAAIRDNYSYRDRLKIDWDELFKTNESTLLAAKTPAEFADLAATMLSKAQDKHLWLQVDGNTIPTFVRPSVPNANYSLLPKLVPNLTKYGKQVVSGRWDDGIGYIAIATFDYQRIEDPKFLLAALNAVKDTRSLIIDVRLNGGGAEPLAAELAGHFVNERKLYGKDVYRDPSSATGFTSPKERWLEPKTSFHYSGRLVVLSGPAVMSSCESFVLMLKQVPGTLVVGGPTQGSSGNPKPHDLGNGVIALIPSWKDMTPDGQELEGVGIPPDIVVNATRADFQTADPVLEAALAELRKPGK
ncbi:MAG: S41 family peptidase [Pirellulales bacterium]